MPGQRALGPSSALSRSKVLPPQEDDIDRWLQIQRTQNALNDPYDKALGGALGFIEGLNPFGGEPQSIKSLRTSRDTGNFLGQIAGGLPTREIKMLGAPMMGVAFGAGKPNMVKFLRKRGEAEFNKVLEEGLEPRHYDLRPRDIVKYPNRELNEPTLHGLSIAQQRWPRLFGHLSEIADVDVNLKAFSKAEKKTTRGALGSVVSTNPQSYKMGKLALDPKHSRPSTVGHELLHLKDRILNEHEDLDYALLKQHYGYLDNPKEVRARAMGARFEDIYNEIMARGGRARDEFGRNIRVPKRK